MTRDWTIREARSWLMERIDDGARCPCCTQRVQRYRRKINSGMAKALIRQWHDSGYNYVHTRNIWMPITKEGAQLQWWRLIEPLPEQREDGGKVGIWRITPLGAAFIKNKLTVKKYVKIFDSKVKGFDGPEVSIVDALGTHFSYDDLMAGL